MSAHMYDHNKICYFLCCVNETCFATANVALSLNKYNADNNYDILIYHNGLRENNKNALGKIEHVILKYFEFDKQFENKMLSLLEENEDIKLAKRNLFQRFISIEIFNLLARYKNVIWLDANIAIQRDISCLTNYGEIALPLSLVNNHCDSARAMLSGEIPEYNMYTDAFVTRCIVVSDNLPDFDQMSSWCYEQCIKYASILKNGAQSIIQLLFQKFDIHPNVLPYFEFCCDAEDEMASVARIVCFNKQKIWEDQSLLQCFPEWFRTHIVWLNLGGDDFDRTHLSLRSIWSQIYGEVYVEPYPSWKNKDLDSDGLKWEKFFCLPRIAFAKLNRNDNTFRFSAFGIPLVKLRKSGPNISIRLPFGLEVFKTRFKKNCFLTYYIFGIPIFLRKIISV